MERDRHNNRILTLTAPGTGHKGGTMGPQSEYIDEIKPKRTKPKWSGVQKGYKKDKSKSKPDYISGVRCSEMFKKKLISHLKTVDQKPSEWHLEALNYYINLQRGDIK